MIVTAQRDTLTTLARQAALSAARQEVLPEIAGIHFAASLAQGSVTLTGTNFETTVRTTGGAVVEEAGGMVVDAKLFPQILERLPQQDVYLETQNNGHVLYIKSGHTEYHIGVLPGSTYPKLELPMPGSTVKMSGLPSLVRQVAFAASAQKQDKPVLRAINLTLSSQGLRATACNSYQLMQVEGDKSCRGDISLLVPASSLGILTRLAKDGDVFEVGTTGMNIVFWDGFLMFSAKLAPGEALDANQVFDAFHPAYQVMTTADALRQAVDTALAAAMRETRLKLALTRHGMEFTCDHGFHAPTEAPNAPRMLHMASQSAAKLEALVSTVPDLPFYQDGQRLVDALSHMSGDIAVEFSQRGDVVIRDGKSRYFQTAMAAPRVQQAIKSKKEVEKAA